jgi:hypothetical protein
MSEPTFKTYYSDGQLVMVGDRIYHGGPNERIVTDIFGPEHEISRWHEMEDGCIAITPSAIATLPLDQDYVFIARGEPPPREGPRSYG